MGSASAWRTWLCAIAVAACGSSPPPPAPAPQLAATDEADPADHESADAAASDDPVTVDTPERSRPPSTMTYEQAMSSPEMLDVKDGRPHLTDDQLRGPVRGLLTKCAVPKNAKVTIRTAVQNGRAIGVSVDVQVDHPRSPAPPKRPSRAAAQRAAALAKQEAKAKKKIAACFDQVVRAVVWPPSSRRDSFTIEF